MQKFANLFATHFCKLTELTQLEVIPLSVIPFWKPLTPKLSSKSPVELHDDWTGDIIRKLERVRVQKLSTLNLLQ